MVKLLFIFILGALNGLAFAPVYDVFVLFISFSIFFCILLRYKSAWQVLIGSYIYTLAYYLSTMYYLTLSLFSGTQGNLRETFYLVLKLFWVAISVYFVPSLAGITTWLTPVTGYRKIILFAVCWAIGSWFVGSLLSAPVGLTGYVFGFNAALAQGASLFGVYGLTFFAVLMATAPAVLFMQESRRTQWTFLSMICLLVISLYTWGTLRLFNAHLNYWEAPVIRLVQTDVSYDAKVKNFYQEFNKLIALSTAKEHDTSPRYIIWPEGALNEVLAEGLDPAFKTRHLFMHIISKVAPPGGAIIFGLERIVLKPNTLTHKLDNIWSIPTVDIKYLYNTLFAVGEKDKMLAVYDAVNLIPFGEYRPIYDIFLTFNLLQTLRTYSPYKTLDYRSGKKHKTFSLDNILPPFSPLVCYEQLFPGDVIAYGKKRPAWILVIANDYWFRNSMGVYQFLEGARFRAIEEGLPLIRVANSGISAVIDPYGRTLKFLKQKEEGFLDTKIPLFLQNKPIYSVLHNYSFLLLLIICLTIIFYPKFGSHN
jgi:apolipoprotein N-acyltransferase